MPVFRNPRDLRRHLEEAAAAQLRYLIIQAQKELGSTAVSPVDTGRLRSSWFASEGTPSGQVAPEGADAPQTDAEVLRVQFGRIYHLTNSLPYAAPIALGVTLPASWGGQHRVTSKPVTWYIDWRNQRLPLIGDAAGRLVKREFGL